MELSEILGGAPAPEETPESTVEQPEPVQAEPEQPTTTVEQPQERPRDELGRFAKQDEPVAQPATPVKQDFTPEERPHVPVAALIEERRKRQELEARLKALEQPAPQIKDDDFWQSPAQATKTLVEHQAQVMQQQIQGLKYELAEDLTRSLHPDYDTVRDGFIAKVTEGDPWAVAIAQQMGAQPNPAKFVYDQSKKLAALSQFEQAGSIDALRARIEAEVRAKLMAEMQKRPAPPEVPRSLNSEPSAPMPTTPEAFEPTPFGALFERPF